MEDVNMDEVVTEATSFISKYYGSQRMREIHENIPCSRAKVSATCFRCLHSACLPCTLSAYDRTMIWKSTLSSSPPAAADPVQYGWNKKDHKLFPAMPPDDCSPAPVEVLQMIKYDEKILEKLLGDIKDGSKYVKHLKDVLETPNSKYLDLIENDIKEYVLKFIKDHFHSTLAEAASKLHIADLSSERVIERISELEGDLKKSEHLKVTLMTKEMKKVVLNVLGENGTKLQEEVKEIVKKVTNPEKLENELIRKDDIGIPIKKLIKEISDSDIANVIKHIISPVHDRGIFDFFHKIGHFFEEIGAKISSKFSGFRDWAKEHWNSALDKVKGAVGSFTALADEFIAHAKEVSITVAKQAWEYLKSHKKQIAKIVFELLAKAALTAIVAG
ncbi:hypothetical protein GQR58_027718 [Nymphon striatum]|nr:hypothetical protein GQR58_027718 [Nymphon striatum]